MAKKTKKVNTQVPAEITEQSAKSTTKAKRIFTVPEGHNINESRVSGEYPLRTYEMFRNLFVGIN